MQVRFDLGDHEDLLGGGTSFISALYEEAQGASGCLSFCEVNFDHGFSAVNLIHPL